MPTENKIQIKNPLTFEFCDYDNSSDRDVLYIDNDPRNVKLNFNITNSSGEKSIYLDPDKDKLEPSPENFHLELQFNPGELSDFSLQQIDLDENSKLHWSMSRPLEMKNHAICLYILKKNDNLEIRQNEAKVITFKGIAANPVNGIRGTAISIRYKDFYFKKSDAGQNDPVEGSSSLNLSIIGRRGLRKAPLAITFAYDDCILNNGQPQAIKLQITNIGQENIPLNEKSQFIITIDADPTGSKNSASTTSQDANNKINPKVKSERWALIKKEDFKSIQLKIEPENQWDYKSNTENEDPFWIITPKRSNNKTLEAGQDIFITLEGVKTSLSAGRGDIYIKYEGLLKYTSDTVILGVKKTWLIEHDHKIGIGKQPTTALDVQGIINATSFVGAGVAIKGMIIMWYGNTNDIPNGWHLCDGTHGTPNLKDRFVMGISKAEDKTEGGNKIIKLNASHLPEHTLTGQTNDDGDHHHILTYRDYSEYKKSDNDKKATLWGIDINNKNQFTNVKVSEKECQTAGKHQHKFTVTYPGKNEPIDILPPYYGLFFIMYQG